MLSEVREGKKIPHDFSYMWNQIKKQTKENRNRPMERENKLKVAKGSGV